MHCLCCYGIKWTEILTMYLLFLCIKVCMLLYKAMPIQFQFNLMPGITYVLVERRKCCDICIRDSYVTAYFVDYTCSFIYMSWF